MLARYSCVALVMAVPLKWQEMLAENAQNAKAEVIPNKSLMKNHRC
ncbi:MAG: hypothetical protein R3D29_02520 [Nitratireductor sp.]